MKFLAALTLSLTVLRLSIAADLVVLTEQNWDQFVPAGKETDAILGDYALKSDRVWAIVAQPKKGRNANMTTKSVGGNIIDLTTVSRPNDQLTAFFATMRRTYEKAEIEVAHGPKVVLTLKAIHDDDKPDVTLSYELEEGSASITIRTVFENSHARPEPANILLDDAYRADDFPQEKGAENIGGMFTLYDHWFDQAYVLVADEHRIASAQPLNKIAGKISYLPEGAANSKHMLKPGEKYELVRRIFPDASALAAKGSALKVSGAAGAAVTFKAQETGGDAAAGILITVNANGKAIGSGRTGPDGTLTAFIPAGKYEAAYSGEGYGASDHKAEFEVAAAHDATVVLPLPKAGVVSAVITAETGEPIPCKVQFKVPGVSNEANDLLDLETAKVPKGEKVPDEKKGAKGPVFGPRTGSTAVMNLCYAADGKFTQKINPGQYEAVISYGPEFDVVRVPLTVAAGAVVPLNTTLKRAFSTPGWISTDYHSHSSPSGDNTCDQRGRVLNLLCEQIEFAPCTEHNRIDTYEGHLKALNAGKLMGTCIGLELTGTPLPLNHQNAFPMVMHPRTQDNGAPLNDADPQVQIRRLAEWDSQSEKLIQQNHPNIGWLFYDKQGDGSVPGGYKDSFAYMNVMEVHPIDTVLEMKPTHKRLTIVENTTIFNWLQLLNQGFRIPGVVNTDAHQAFHGSGGLRNYVRNDTKVPGDIRALDIVRDSKKGHLVMSTAPFMTVSLNNAFPGDDLALPGGKGELAVTVQCANWYDIDRVQVLVNGRPDPKLNFTRKENPETFGNGTMKFDRKIPIALEKDAHLIVVAVGEKELGDVFGPQWGKQKPAAVSNPIFVDVDGGGFTPNKDTLDAPLPVRAGAPRK